MGDYLGGNVDESAIKESFSLVYQLLEEMMDNGYPLTTEPNALKAMIRPPTTFVRMVTAATGKVRQHSKTWKKRSSVLLESSRSLLIAHT